MINNILGRKWNQSAHRIFPILSFMRTPSANYELSSAVSRARFTSKKDLTPHKLPNSRVFRCENLIFFVIDKNKNYPDEFTRVVVISFKLIRNAGMGANYIIFASVSFCLFATTIALQCWQCGQYNDGVGSITPCINYTHMVLKECPSREHTFCIVSTICIISCNYGAINKSRAVWKFRQILRNWNFLLSNGRSCKGRTCCWNSQRAYMNSFKLIKAFFCFNPPKVFPKKSIDILVP